MYKRKKDKVKPVNRPHKEGPKPEEVEKWKEQIAVYKGDDRNKSGSQYPWLIPKFSNIERGRRLTPKRIKKLKIGESVASEERIVLLEVPFNREAGIAFDFTAKGYFKPEVEPPHAIRTIQHDQWEVSNFRVPKALDKNVTEIINAKLDCGALEKSFGPYRNPWFLVPKKAGKYRLINAAQRLNAVTIKDASLPPSADDFSEEFAGFPLLSLLDLFSGYDQYILAPESRDMTAFMTPFGLLRMTTLPQGYTNGVQVFDRVIRKVLKDVISENRGKPFIDDIAVKPKTKSYFRDSNGRPEEVAPGIRRFVLEAIISLDRVLADIERAEATISGEKSEFWKESLKVVAYICREKRRSPEEVKMKKIEDWPPCKNVTDVRAFIGLCVYYRIWIIDFSVIAEPLFRLMKNDQDFVWQEDQQEAMGALKKSLTEAPALKPIDYESSGQIVLSVDSSLQGWGAILQQEEVDIKKRHPARYES